MNSPDDLVSLFLLTPEGTSNFVNKKRQVTVIESAEVENERQKLLNKIFCKLKDLEDEK